MILTNKFLWLTWNPSKIAFTIPFVDIDVAWYGVLFALGFFIGYLMIIPLFKEFLLQHRKISNEDAKEIAIKAADTLMWFTIIGTVVGARLGHMLFYDFQALVNNPLELFMLRNGGLASHGGTAGVMLAIVFYLRYTRKLLPELTFVSLMDIMVIPTAIVAVCIRLGNFINQEILGTVSTAPWAIIFGHPADGSLPAPRHPAQLYEAALYAFTFLVVFSLWLWGKREWQKTGKIQLKTGLISGVFFLLVFGGRFLIEFFKEPQGGVVDESFLQIGQYLSIPFVILGAWLVVSRKDKKGTKGTKRTE